MYGIYYILENNLTKVTNILKGSKIFHVLEFRKLVSSGDEVMKERKLLEKKYKEEAKAKLIEDKKDKTQLDKVINQPINKQAKGVSKAKTVSVNNKTKSVSKVRKIK